MQKLCFLPLKNIGQSQAIKVNLGLSGWSNAMNVKDLGSACLSPERTS